MGTLDGKVAIVAGGGTGIGRAMLKHRILIGRAGHYLASHAARYVTGSTLAVDGGWTAS